MPQINIAIFGISNVGSTLIKQIDVFNKKSKNKHLNVFCIANSTRALFQEKATEGWSANFDQEAHSYELEDVYAFAKALKEKQNNFEKIDVLPSPSWRRAGDEV